MAIASVKNLSKVYGKPGSDVRVHALRGVSIDFEEAETVAIIGQSGSGKSTLMNLLGCLDRPTTGEYWLGDTDVARLSDDELSDARGQRIGFVFQSFNLINQLTIEENLEVPLFYQGMPASQRKAKARDLAELVGLGDRMLHRPNQLSGGQQQRAAIARALINDPLIVLADEPTGNLDTATTEEILAIFENLHTRGRTILMVTHEMDVAERCDRIITLRDGAIISDTRGGTPVASSAPSCTAS
ncbi:MAG: ABC transporter ATP-binding protein [Phycisphaerae bacterium]